MVRRTLAHILFEVLGETLVIIAVLLITIFTPQNWPSWFNSLPLLSKSSMIMLILIAGVGLRAVAGKFGEGPPAWRFSHDSLA